MAHQKNASVLEKTLQTYYQLKQDKELTDTDRRIIGHVLHSRGLNSSRAIIPGNAHEIIIAIYGYTGYSDTLIEKIAAAAGIKIPEKPAVYQ
jgi:hypothetical protein